MAGPLTFDRVLESSTTTGTGTYTLAGAVTGYQSFAAVGNANTCPYVAWEVNADGNPSGGWEVGVGTYTAAGTTLARTKILASSNSGNAVDWAAGTRHIALTLPANYVFPTLGGFVPGGRLTLTSGVPVTGADVTAAGTLYYTPYLHNQIRIFDGAVWKWYTFAELSLALTLTSGKNYDVFIYDDAGTLTLELSAAWTNDTTRADALTTQDGVTVKSGATTRLWLGTLRASGANTTEDSGGGVTTQVGGKRFLWNAYNRVNRWLRVIDTTDTWSYTTGTARVANGATAPLNCVEFVCGLAGMEVSAEVVSTAALASNVTRFATVGVGVNASTFAGLFCSALNTSASTGAYSLVGNHKFYARLGYSYAAWLEYGADGTNIWYGDGAGLRQSGLAAEVMA